MYCRAIACDFDGTSATGGRLAPEVAEALAAARAAGIAALLVTGRVLEELDVPEHDLTGFDAVVAENGAVVWLPRAGRTIQLGVPPPEHMLGELRARGVPFHAGAVVVGTWGRHVGDLLELIRRFGLDSQIVFNREAVMLLPGGVNKAAGVQRALEELGRSVRNLAAFGDAENDLPLLAIAELAVAPRGSVPAVLAAADDRITQPGAAGVAWYIRRLVEQGGLAPTPARRHLRLGRDAAGAAVVLPASGTNVLVSGDPRSGKSWLAGLVAEQLIDHGYRLCIIDPEGDYLALARRPGILGFGRDLPLPAPRAVPAVLWDVPGIVLDLSSLALPDKVGYVDAVLCAIDGARVATGVPQWVFVDEAHYFFHERAPCARRFEGRSANFLFVTYRPSLVAEPVYAAVGAHLVMPTLVEEERYFVTGLLQAHGPTDLAASDALAALQAPSAGLLLQQPTGPRWAVFAPEERVTPHAHHGRKYAELRLPPDKAFRFHYSDGAAPVVAHSVAEFCTALEAVPMGSLRHHLLAGDFSRWAHDVLDDPELAGGLRKLERTTLAGAPPSRAEILRHVKDRYLI
jgi:hydroxymethylpyrimidine pyrophosphatase-like HAD family hydrolase